VKNPWSFGIIFLIVLFYLSYNNFELPVIFWGETVEVKGKIYDIKFIPSGYQKIYFWYEYQDSLYTGDRQIGKSFGAQAFGNGVMLTIDKSNPAKHKAHGSYKFFRNNRNVKTLHIKATVEKLRLINGIAQLINEQDKAIGFGEYTELGDSTERVAVSIILPKPLPKRVYQYDYYKNAVQVE
jgi:hypothetical protein